MQSEKDALIERYAGDAFKNRNNPDLPIGVWRQHFVEFSDKMAALSAAEPQPAPSVAVKALEFYANTSHWQDGRFVQGEEPNVIHAIMCTIDSDQGKTARSALSALSAQVQDVAGWQPIETADKNVSQLLLGIVRRDVLEETHVGGYRWSMNDDEVSCWWSDQADDEIVPTHWMPLPSVPAAPAKQEGGTNE